jgi:UDP-glucose 4-epimerase
MADTSRIRTEPGWEPAHSDLEDIVRDGWNARQVAEPVRTA